MFAQFPKTVSAMATETGHDGIFFVNAASASDYIREHGPTVIRYNKNSKVPPDVAALNIGQVKGETFERVILFLPDTMTGYLTGKKSKLAPKSAAQLYVAVTRAMHSVAVVLP
ncbi:ATP-binding domain-containing protein [Tessaracoccus sp. MC1679]|uniref:ATP-binding domain-containing protein n=1 Tax=Tessaracoccus sp. MC1679 TaxID=2760313 RepID=UPI0016033A63|nr:ATP-binding domain-containing protein [Tessaracoccus sp. MC1679]MBB1517352.1 ATP-binding domain-containing protein [Tessaracoccus sp. MC1679]